MPWGQYARGRGKDHCFNADCNSVSFHMGVICGAPELHLARCMEREDGTEKHMSWQVDHMISAPLLTSWVRGSRNMCFGFSVGAKGRLHLIISKGLSISSLMILISSQAHFLEWQVKKHNLAALAGLPREPWMRRFKLVFKEFSQRAEKLYSPSQEGNHILQSNALPLSYTPRKPYSE